MPHSIHFIQPAFLQHVLEEPFEPRREGRIRPSCVAAKKIIRKITRQAREVSWSRRKLPSFAKSQEVEPLLDILLQGNRFQSRIWQKLQSLCR